ncbi:hypothetical protein [Streptomyces sp. NPDC018833]|uniref:hypothetical protein n=1 Tax=Streptomyces sp. NPDC018833 TaxID=3365053 RepID=UPI0037A3A313
MAIMPPVVVYPPSSTGGRRVRLDSRILGVAYELRDLADFLRHAGLDPDVLDVENTELIEWRGGGPHVWPKPPP